MVPLLDGRRTMSLMSHAGHRPIDSLVFVAVGPIFTIETSFLLCCIDACYQIDFLRWVLTLSHRLQALS